jgi:hypothetical protein
MPREIIGSTVESEHRVVHVCWGRGGKAQLGTVKPGEDGVPDVGEFIDLDATAIRATMKALRRALRRTYQQDVAITDQAMDEVVQVHEDDPEAW